MSAGTPRTSMPPWMPKRVVVNTPGTTRTRSSIAVSPNRSIDSSLIIDTERGVSMSGLAKPKDEALGAVGRMFRGSVTIISSISSSFVAAGASPSAASADEAMVVLPSSTENNCSRARARNPREDLGIDRNMWTPSGKVTDVMRVCVGVQGVRRALRRAPYPRLAIGIIEGMVAKPTVSPRC